MIIKTERATIELRHDFYSEIQGMDRYTVIKCRGFQDASIAEGHQIQHDPKRNKWYAPRHLRKNTNTAYDAIKEIIDLY